jgi:cell division septal protein FtsQ
MPALVGRLDASLANGKFPAFMIVIVTGLMLWAFLLTDDYRIETVSVEGLQHGDGAAVIAEADVLDRSAFRVQPAAAAERIAELPFVESVKLDLSFPGRATIRIVERRPALNVEHDGKGLLVSSEARVIATGSVEGLPTLRLDNRGASLDEALSAQVIAASKAIAAVYGPDVTLVWNADIGLVLEMPTGELVNFGPPEHIDAKLTVLAAIESQLAAGWSQLDLSVPTRPSYQ